MNSGISQTLMHYWSAGRKTKTTPSGWISGNSVCCVHNGERADTRGRGGVNPADNGGIIYSCFNCGFKASWMPGRPLSKKMKKLMQWLNVSDDEISKMALYALKTQEEVNNSPSWTPMFSTVALPEHSVPIDFDSNPENPDLAAAIAYARKRRLHETTTTFYWSNTLSYKKYLIIPFEWQGETVGWTGRATDDMKKPKYLSSSRLGYVYNVDAQVNNKNFCILCEGVVDAALIGGCSTLGNDINQQQIQILNALGKPIIVLPDRDEPGKKILDVALNNGWWVSFPPWGSGIKDAADAVLKYGTLYTLYSIVQHAQRTNLKIQLAAKTWFNK